MIDVYPKHEQLANISGQSQGTGGSPYNVLLDLAKLGASFPLVGAGLVGQDALGNTFLMIVDPMELTLSLSRCLRELPLPTRML
jgi:hypothetical protein